MEYCDVLAAIIIDGLKNKFTAPVAFFGAQSKLDLHPEEGYLLSTNKVITCQDNKGNRYKITVEANSATSLTEKLEESNRKHSRNGDPLGYALDAVSLKLSFRDQDPSILAEITDEELEALRIEVQAARESSQEKVVYANF